MGKLRYEGGLILSDPIITDLADALKTVLEEYSKATGEEETDWEHWAKRLEEELSEVGLQVL